MILVVKKVEKMAPRIAISIAIILFILLALRIIVHWIAFSMVQLTRLVSIQPISNLYVRIYHTLCAMLFAEVLELVSQPISRFPQYY